MAFSFCIPMISNWIFIIFKIFVKLTSKLPVLEIFQNKLFKIYIICFWNRISREEFSEQKFHNIWNIFSFSKWVFFFFFEQVISLNGEWRCSSGGGDEVVWYKKGISINAFMLYERWCRKQKHFLNHSNVWRLCLLGWVHKCWTHCWMFGFYGAFSSCTVLFFPKPHKICNS